MGHAATLQSAFMDKVHRDGKNIVEAADLGGWRGWLASNHSTADPVWVTNSKKDGDVPAVSYPDARDEALCWGWIDSTVNRLDEHRYLTLFARRNPKSGWSKVNKERIEALRREGRMQEPGEAAIALAVANGSWTLLDSIEALEVPDDLAAALKADPAALRGFDSMPPGMKKVSIRRVALSKRAETRARKINEAVELARGRGGRDS
jgi:uncharacterized protein YdeI (YjbR/CyaY-like superfamily)